MLLGAFVGSMCACAVLRFAPPAQDLAAHAYRASLVSHGVFLWDNYWYAGSYPLATYSLLAPVLSVALGVAALVVACTAAAGALFSSIAIREWGRDGRWPARTFAAAAALPLLPGLDAYVLGVPLLLATIFALQRGRRPAALGFAALTLAASPLAFLFLAGIVAAICLAGRAGRRSVMIVGSGIVGLGALEAVAVLVVFPASGVYPFLAWHLLAVGGLALAGTLLAYSDRSTRPIAMVLAVWGVAGAASFLVANPIGDNVARLRYAVFPLLLLLVVRGHRRGFASIVAVAALVYAAGPDLIQVSGQADASSAHAAAWAPAVAYLHRHLPVGARVEVVPTSARWEAYYLPVRGVPLARGWFRQTDLARNGVLYRRGLNAETYDAWLTRTAVQYVLLTPFPLDDQGAGPEARVVRSPRSGLRVVWKHAGFTIYSATHRARLMTGAAGVRLTTFGHDQMAGTARHSGTATLRVIYSPYWLANGAAECVVRGRDGMSEVQFDHSGHFSLKMARNPLTIAHRVADPDC